MTRYQYSAPAVTAAGATPGQLDLLDPEVIEAMAEELHLRHGSGDCHRTPCEGCQLAATLPSRQWITADGIPLPTPRTHSGDARAQLIARGHAGRRIHTVEVTGDVL